MWVASANFAVITVLRKNTSSKRAAVMNEAEKIAPRCSNTAAGQEVGGETQLGRGEESRTVLYSMALTHHRTHPCAAPRPAPWPLSFSTTNRASRKVTTRRVSSSSLVELAPLPVVDT